MFGFGDDPGDGAGSPKTAWDVGAGDGEDGKGYAQRDEEREDEGFGIHLNFCG